METSAERVRADPWLTEKEAADELQVSLGTVRAERIDGRLGYASIRRRIFYPMSCIDEYRTSKVRRAACQISPSSNDAIPLAGTSLGAKDAEAAMFQRVRRIVKKLQG
jgi:hypothetical protein